MRRGYFQSPNKERTPTTNNKNDGEHFATSTNLFSGHCLLRYYLKKIGKAKTDMNRFYECEIMIVDHVLCYCRILALQRLLHYGEE